MGNFNEAMRSMGYLRVPEPPITDLMCPHCAAVNADERKHYIWRVSDERGLHAECDACGASWVPDAWTTRPAP